MCDPNESEVYINWVTWLRQSDQVGSLIRPAVKISKDLSFPINAPWPTDVYLCNAQMSGMARSQLWSLASPDAIGYYGIKIDEFDIQTSCSSDRGDNLSLDWTSTSSVSTGVGATNMTHPSVNHQHSLILPVQLRQDRGMGTVSFVGWNYPEPILIGRVQKTISRLGRLTVTISNEAGNNPFENVSNGTNSFPIMNVLSNANNITTPVDVSTSTNSWEVLANNPTFSATFLLKRPCDGKK